MGFMVYEDTKKSPSSRGTWILSPPTMQKKMTFGPRSVLKKDSPVEANGSPPPSPNTMVARAKVHFDLYLVSDVWEAPHAYDRRMAEETLLRLYQLAERRKANGGKNSPVRASGHTDPSPAMEPLPPAVVLVV